MTTESRKPARQNPSEPRSPKEMLALQPTWLGIVLYSIGDAVIVTDAEGNVTFMNPVAQSLTGWTQEEAIGIPLNTVFTIIHEASRQTVEIPAINAMQEGLVFGLVNSLLIAKESRERPIDGSAARIRDEQGNVAGVVLVFRDITERKRMQEEIAELARFPGENPNPVFRVDANGIVLYANKASSVQGCTSQVGEPLKCSGCYESIQESLRTGQIRQIDRKCDGKMFALTFAPVESKYVTVYSMDITERKLAEQEVRASEERYRGLVELSPDAILINRNNRFTFVNPAALRLFGASSADQLLGKSPFELFHPDYHEIIRARIHQLLQGQQAVLIEEKVVRLDGRAVDVEVAASPFADQEGQGIQVILRDITERKWAEEALQQMRLQLTHVARLSTLGEMAAELAHELNHPLYAILNYAKACRNVLAEEGLPNLDSLREWNEEISEIALSAGEAVKRLRSFARRAESPHTACRVEEIVEEALRLIAVETRKVGVTVETSFSAALPSIQVDRVQIQQILVNLLSNAMEAMQTSPADMRRITIRASARDEAIEVAVSDCGVGLPPGSETRIFEPYVTTKPEGMGMGLSIVRTIVEAHGGRLWAKSNPEGGATFYFTLPLEEGGHPHAV